MNQYNNLTVIIVDKKEKMKKKSFKVSDKVDTCGTSLQGCVNISFNKLVKVFGKPNFDSLSGDDKVRVEWNIKFKNGTVATIYDWKNYDKSNDWVKKNEKEWHIGGKSDAAVLMVITEIKKVFQDVVTKEGEYYGTVTTVN